MRKVLLDSQTLPPRVSNCTDALAVQLTELAAERRSAGGDTIGRTEGQA